MKQITPNVLTLREVASLLKVSAPTVKKMMTNGELHYRRVGAQYRFLESDITDWLSNGHNEKVSQ